MVVISYNWGPDAENHENFEIAQNRQKSFLAQTLFVGDRWDPENPRILVPWPSGHLHAGSACLGVGVRISPTSAVCTRDFRVKKSVQTLPLLVKWCWGWSDGGFGGPIHVSVWG